MAYFPIILGCRRLQRRLAGRRGEQDWEGGDLWLHWCRGAGTRSNLSWDTLVMWGKYWISLFILKKIIWCHPEIWLEQSGIREDYERFREFEMSLCANLSGIMKANNVMTWWRSPQCDDDYCHSFNICTCRMKVDNVACVAKARLVSWPGNRKVEVIK